MNYTIKNSPQKRDELFKFFNNYGGNGIQINIGPNIDELYK